MNNREYEEYSALKGLIVLVKMGNGSNLTLGRTASPYVNDVINSGRVLRWYDQYCAHPHFYYGVQFGTLWKELAETLIERGTVLSLE